MTADPEKARLADAIEIAAWKDLYAAAPVAMIHGLGLEVVRVADACCFVARGLPVSMFNRCIGLGNERLVKESDLDEVLSVLDVRASWVQHGPASRTPAITSWLGARGLSPAPRSWAKFLRDAEPTTTMSTPFEIREVTKKESSEFARVLADAHGMPAKLAEWTEVLIGRPGWHGYAAIEGDRVVAGGMAFIHGERAWLGLGGTTPAFREKGAQSVILSHRIEEAIKAGVKVLGVETAEMPQGKRAISFASVVEAKFQKVATRSNYERT